MVSARLLTLRLVRGSGFCHRQHSKCCIPATARASCGLVVRRLATSSPPASQPGDSLKSDTPSDRGIDSSAAVHEQVAGSKDNPEQQPVDSLVSEEPLGPLVLSEEVCIYESTVDIEAVIAKTHDRCKVGAGFTAIGFSEILAAIASSASPPMMALVVGGAAATVYKHLVVSRREMVTSAMRHVERVTLLPNVSGKSPTSTTIPVKEEDAVRHLVATPALELKLHTPSLEVKLKVVEPASDWEGGKYTGFVADGRQTLGTFCCKGGLLHLDGEPASGHPGSPISADPALLAALLASPKVVQEQEAQIRSDARGALTPEKDAAKMMIKHIAAPLKATKKDANKSDKITPVMEIEQHGQQAMVSGFFMMALGALLFTWRNSDTPFAPLASLVKLPSQGQPKPVN